MVRETSREGERRTREAEEGRGSERGILQERRVGRIKENLERGRLL